MKEDSIQSSNFSFRAASNDIDKVDLLIFEIGHGVKDLTGLDYFTSLRVLNYLYSDETIDEPIKLDVSKHTKLEELRCWNLSELTLGEKPNLTSLDCMGSQLTTLDVSTAPELKWLDCRNNQLTELNLSNNPKIEILYCDVR